MKYASSIDPSFVANFRDAAVPWGPVGYITYKRTYSRRVDEARTEEWWQTVERCCNGLLKIGGAFTQEEIQALFAMVFSLKCNFSGRALWQLGTPTVERLGGDSLQNCFAGETEVWTLDGVFAISEIVGRPVVVRTVTREGWERWVETTFRSFGEQELYEVTFSDGTIVRATSDHEWMKFENGRPVTDKARSVFTKDLAGKRVPFMAEGLEVYDPEGYAHGFVFGDGTLAGDFCRVEIFPAKADMVDLIAGYGELTSWTIAGVETPVVTGLPRHWKALPKNPSKSYALGFVLGLISADGNVRNTVRVHNKSRDVLLAVQRLARHAGLRCHAPYLDREISPFDGSVKECWCVSISTYNLRHSHFVRDNQAAALVSTRDPQSVTVTSVRPLGVRETVYCCVVPETHNFQLANGVQTFNCWHVGVNSLDAFTFTFNELMLGGGVGFNITPQFVYELPPVKFNVLVERVETFDCDFLVPDNREGWVELLDRILNAFFFTGKSVRYNTFGIRDKGVPIKGFGGVASGAEELVRGMGLIVKILQSAHGRKLTPRECLDIMNIIGMIVVAGNVRRSAEIACGDARDFDFLHAKNWSRFKIPPWRQHSNNSVIESSIHNLPSDFWEPYEGQGEPYGLINLDLCRRFGRLADGPDHRPDPRVVGVNPCGEITLEAYEACNLAEIYLPRLDDLNEFVDAAGLMYKAVKTISTLPFTHPKTNEVVSRNHRLGIGVTGFCAAQHLHDPGIFDAVYDQLEDLDKEYSKVLRCPESIKLTTVKPSGTSSLLPGVPPGVHPEFAPHYLRRITFAANNPLVDVARDHGYHVEPKINIDGSLDYNSMIIAFPVKARDGAITEKRLTAVDQLNNQLFLQRHWSDNSVSMTCYYKPEELPAMQDWLAEHYTDHVKTCSFLRHQGHGFKQAPYEEITEAEYREYRGRVTPITHIADCSELNDTGSLECSTGGCPIK